VLGGGVPTSGGQGKQSAGSSTKRCPRPSGRLSSHTPLAAAGPAQCARPAACRCGKRGRNLNAADTTPRVSKERCRPRCCCETHYGPPAIAGAVQGARPAGVGHKGPAHNARGGAPAASQGGGAALLTCSSLNLLDLDG